MERTEPKSTEIMNGRGKMEREAGKEENIELTFTGIRGRGGVRRRRE